MKYFEQYLNGYVSVGKPFPGPEKRLTLTTIRLSPVPNFETPPSAAGCGMCQSSAAPSRAVFETAVVLTDCCVLCCVVLCSADPYFILSRLDRRVFYNHKTANRGVVPFFLRDPDPNFVPGGTSIAPGAAVTIAPSGQSGGVGSGGGGASGSGGGGANGVGGPSNTIPGVDQSGSINPGHVDIRCSVTFYGDVKLSFYDYEKGTNGDQRMFHTWLNPNFIAQNYVCITKDHLEGAMKDKDCRHFPASFKLELYFANPPAVKEAIVLSDPDPTTL